MRSRLTLILAVFVAAISSSNSTTRAHDRDDDRDRSDQSIQLGPRPFYLVDGMDDGPLKSKLEQCKAGPFYRTTFSIGHRGAALQFPEHTKEAYQAGARMGAGIVECDTTFTKDGDLVCRHSDCDLHTTTNILATPLRNKCVRSWTDGSGNWMGPFDANDPSKGPLCCTWNLSLSEFKSLQGKMDSANPAATTLAGYMNATPSFRTDDNAGRGTLMTLRDSIELNRRNGVKHTPELKAGDAGQIASIFGGQPQYAQAFADELRNAGARPRNVWEQSFNLEDIFYWIDHTEYGDQAVYLLDYDDVKNEIIVQPPYDSLSRPAFLALLKNRGVKVVAPAMPALLKVEGGHIVPSQLARDLREKGFEIITWTFERSDLRQGASKAGFYYDFDPTGAVIKKDSDMYKALDVLAKDVKIIGIFSDWPATVTYYANCMGIR